MVRKVSLSGFKIPDQNARSVLKNGDIHVMNGGPNGPVYVSSDIVLETSPSPVKAPVKEEHSGEHSVFF